MGEEDTSAFDKKKSHRERLSGRKAEKKKNKKKASHSQELTDKQRNPKAFAFNSAVRAERQFRRKQDIETKKQHVPLIDRTPVEPPPILIAVVGPPKVGKSTLINNLIKLFTKSPLTDIKGPVTIVTGKKRRITLIECNNDINSMIDLAKVADLVLLLCDASFGFEMEVFEFLNICQVHGMPRIMGVLTHLDMIKNTKTLKNTKKVLKHRFWTEVYQGAKLFYLSGILHGEYLRNEIRNLGRFISIIKFRPLTWRTTHSYLLGDRYEDLTSQELVRKNPKCDRNISLYGYVRGVPLIKNTSVHIAGLGDLKIQDVSYLPDPCPLPEVIKKRSLVEKEKLIYAPFSGVGGIVYDKDAVYVDLGGSHSHNRDTKQDDESKNLMSTLIDTKETLDMKMRHSEMQIFTGGKKLTASDIKEYGKSNTITGTEEVVPGAVDSDLDDELERLRSRRDFSGLKEEKVTHANRTRRKVIFEQSDEEFVNTINEGEDAEGGSEVEVGEKETGNEYTVLKENKDKEVHDKIASTLKYFEKKEKVQKILSSKKLSDELSELEPEDDSAQEISKKKFSKKEQMREISSSKSSTSEPESDSETKEKSNKKRRKKDESDVENDLNESVVKTEADSSDEDESSDEDYMDNYNNIRNNINIKEAGEMTCDVKDKTQEESNSSDEEDMAVKWKQNLAEKARNAFLDRQRTTQNIMKLVYGVFDKKKFGEQDDVKEEPEEGEEDIGGLFRVVSSEQKRLKEEKEKRNIMDTSLIHTWKQLGKDWLQEENKALIANCFVTGKWKQSEDAEELLKLDDMNEFSDDNSEVYGDFEDLETGEKHTASTDKLKDNEEKSKDKEKEVNTQTGGKRKRPEVESIEVDRETLAEKKRKLKEKFDAEYDNVESTSYYDDLKTSAEKQAQLNKAVFENMPDDLRVQIEGYRPGMYVRVEFENVPPEFVTNFDPTYPLLIGALNIGEENIGYVNVKLKKHRWYKKILKTSDPLIVSLGWRRFQTIPLFSKLEDDLKYRYLKYTPEHVTCNAHFWGPITPQGTGFLALQSCDGKLENIKQQGFRIAATGSVQELEKSTQVMKKLKLIGYPMKIYKKTAFIKDMFNSALEVAKFEGARIKTVSGIRGQIKKAAGKPEGCFRATFEDKIQLSDIVFCRTWYKVDVPKFYCPVNTLLLPPERKNSWQGVRTTGQIKRDKGIKAEPNADSLYTEIKREPKVFKPLIVPRKLQRELPYRDKPKFGPLKSDMKPDPEKKRVAVIREPYEQKVAKMLKMLRASYEHKQAQLKAAMSDRISKHKAEIDAIEARKLKRQKKDKKEALRVRSKAKIREEKKGKK